jgi:L-ascorbate 6-phosphate lactonase
MTASNFSKTIATREVPANQLAIYWLCQAGFAFKGHTGQIVYVDPYLSDVVERVIGFKRMTVSPTVPENVKAEVIVCTHEHLDHLDVDSLPIIAKNPSTQFVGPIECMKKFAELGISLDRCHLLEEEKAIEFDGVKVTGVFADHGTLAPDALGVILDFGDIRIYHTGDTAYRPKEFEPVIKMRPDVLLPCINGAFGNMNALEAAQLTQLIAPRVVLPTHFWMFVEQNGDPKSFIEHCSKLAPDTQVVLATPGQEFCFQKSL